ncbi:hypothetical protein CFIO01_04398 [Colletotrichum fioriniae PJ7]|uniref:Uncharacterized protein n=1 Tax=Colletotrichum fioriniae PJ7 TaxID=1445577 RepID=A0A010R9N9_9PEZI|nr:hypothetical protein CFIO01_04398 [Colletotrichum fioriniae PJ7]
MPLVPVYSFEELNAILSAGSNAVTNAYQQFRLVFPGRSMMEIGLTDTFITQAQMLSSGNTKDAFFEWSNNENITGSDFVVKVNKNQTTDKFDVLFQAKVAKKEGQDTYADFLYESTKTIGRVKVMEYQNILLAQYAKETSSEA